MPTLQDVVALPEGPPVLPDGHSGRSRLRRHLHLHPLDAAVKIEREVRPALSALADIAHNDFDGRVSLVKNVFADKQTVQSMFGSQVTAFASLRTAFGADGRLENDFFRDTLGSLTAPRV